MGNKLSKQTGAKIVVHDSRNPPLPDENGFELHPNTATFISMQKTNFKRLKTPYVSKCMDSWNETRYDIKTKALYSQIVCF